MPQPNEKPDDDGLPDFAALNRKFAADRAAQFKQAQETPNVPGGANFDEVKGGPYAKPGVMESARLNAIDKFTFGLAPAMDDLIRKPAEWLYGKDKLPPSMREQLIAGDQINPVASTIGGGIGAMGNLGSALKLAQGLKSLPMFGEAAQRAAAFGGLNAADQAVRTQTEDRPFSPTEVGGSAIIGAVDPIGMASKGLGAAGNLLGGNKLLGSIYDMAKRILPNATPGAAPAAAAGPLMHGPPMPPVAGAAPKPPPVGGRYTGGAGFPKSFQPIPGVAPPGAGPVQGPPAPAQVFGPPRPVPGPAVPAPKGLIDTLGDLYDTGANFVRSSIYPGAQVGSNEREERKKRKKD